MKLAAVNMPRFALIICVVLWASAVCAQQTPVGYGPWRLGMTKDEIATVAQFGPYSAVQSTNGLETPNGLFQGQKTNISFVFGPRGLSKIQIWAYEGQDLELALSAWQRVYEFTSQQYGKMEAPALLQASAVSSAQVVQAIRTRLAAIPKSEPAKFQMAPIQMPTGLSVFASFFRHPQYGFYVFLYCQEP